MKTELDLLAETLQRLEQHHTEQNRRTTQSLKDLAAQFEQWALALHTLASQVDGLSAQLKRFENALPKR